ncbi:glycosyltransferase family 2 protein [Polynucleobacter paneuropaeus]|jgi:GT2 family glycosyltransferase|uniref:Glycosyltransferase 2-like domain-containing protein n=1 Tax=Polynucleobacter paneuropaeus TaxID=2527775 RepID=A0ABX9FCA7_9BURK|nr:glycosyltransferase family A protein [Polynucleobacter paneuropaeus]MBT8518948.1 glycosyltransferase family 2 protein [Polynucleobacter paneuropaeus]MBT8520067.1 glycosyltransferase family 2 protein [Polynucleobacter paneuropaeus]MBT8529254.1 glycosyltransferase family 2 protein [Polynucleobacter paneuropaeus]MBT8532456.1 glycosyltransferase family 2 protein [Polynucleobacter paneuropaeus]MBT8567888.1 glycosyltransferase family 2 protein [Polynucleobacter paneuropaeus]
MMNSIYQYLRAIHRRLRKGIKTRLNPEISQRKVRAFIKAKRDTSKSVALPAISPSIAIVIPCYGHAPFLKEMFESIKQQTRAPDQVIFVLDHSPDTSAEIITRLVQNFQSQTSSQFIVLHNEKNMGQAASLNRGIEYSTCDLIMILNDDDYLMHDCIETAIQLLGKYPQAALLGGHSLHFSSEQLVNTPKVIQSIYKLEDIQIDLRTPQKVLGYRGYNDINMTHSGSCFYKSAWQAIGGYYPDKSMRLVHFSDRDFQIRMNAIFPVILSNITPLSCWRNDSSVDQGVNS